MRSCRSMRRFAASLGLVALMLQLALSFAHIHRSDILPSSLVSLAGHTAADARASGQTDDNQIPGLPDDDCPICAVMHLAGTIDVPSPPALPLPAHFTFASLEAHSASFVGIANRFPFQTRAPPAA
jgi:hypothetical protein